MIKNTILCIDLKTFLQEDALLKIGKSYRGSLKLDGDYHAAFVESHRSSSDGKRNPRIYDGDYISVTLQEDGSPRMYFKAVKAKDLSNVDGLAIAVCNEIREALSGFVVK